MNKKLVDELFERYPRKPFEPIAYHNANLRMISVRLEDCSVTEREISKKVALLVRNHGRGRKIVGFEVFSVCRQEVLDNRKLAEFVRRLERDYSSKSLFGNSRKSILRIIKEHDLEIMLEKRRLEPDEAIWEL